jgi:DNA-binding IclR family transcriptional regulator
MTAPESWYATRTLSALELLAFRPSSAAEVAHALQVHPRTARRLLNRLVADGYVTRTEGERRVYRPTMRLVALAGQVVERSELAQRAAPAVERLHRETGAAAHLSVPSYRSVLCLVHRAGPASDALRPQLRELVPAHSTAAGKVLLAHRLEWRTSVLSQELERYTERTLVEPAELEREAARIRDRGLAIEDGEYRTTQRGIAAPVFDASGEAVAALGIAGPADRLGPHALAVASPSVRRLAVATSQDLGFVARQAVPEARA